MFSITSEQLGKRGKCPHCRAVILLPRSTNQTRYQQEQLEPPSRFAENLMCGFLTAVFHLLLLMICAMVPWGDFSDRDPGEGESILIGQLARQQLVESPSDELIAEDASSLSDSFSDDTLDSSQLLPDATDPSSNQFDLLLPSQFGNNSGAEQLQNQDGSVLAGGGENFGQLLSRLRQNGLDIVIVFDSTSSMGGEIEVVKSQIERIGSVLFKLVPATRIGICTYRDSNDEYEVKGLPLTDNLATIILFLERIGAMGGGDVPEAVHSGLKWATTKNKFRRRARKVILLFGDAPPHVNKNLECQKIASDFRKSGGIVSTVTCRRRNKLEELVSIATIGGGESYLTQNEREIMAQLMVLVFGTQHRDKVLESFKMLDQ